MDDRSPSPMPSGVQSMTKQELWNWFCRSQRAAAEDADLKRKFFTTTTQLHTSHYKLWNQPFEIIEMQRKRIQGLEMQMAQMQKGYKKKFEKLEKKSNEQV